MKKASLKFILSVFAALLLVSGGRDIRAESVAEKAQGTRLDMIRYLRALRPMVFNFPCDNVPVCTAGLKLRTDKDYAQFERVQLYNQIKRKYQEGLIFFYEGDYINAYTRFLDSQANTEVLLESLSQLYLDRSQSMMREAIEKKHPDERNDMSVTDIAMELGPGSKLRRDFKMSRQAGIEGRRYDSRMYHYAEFKYRIEENMKMGYHNLGVAKEARIKALDVDKVLQFHQKMDERLKSKRIEYYFASIRYARLAKLNAEELFHLKYPYDDYALMNPSSKTEKTPDGKPAEIPVIAGYKMEWAKNPYIYPAQLNPVFDLAVPEEFRADTVDIRNLRYDDEVDVNVRFRYLQNKPTEPQEVGSQGAGPATGGTPAGQ